MSVPSSIATRPARLMPGPSLRPTAWPTRTAAAMLMPKAIMDVIMVIEARSDEPRVHWC